MKTAGKNQQTTTCSSIRLRRGGALKWNQGFLSRLVAHRRACHLITSWNNAHTQGRARHECRHRNMSPSLQWISSKSKEQLGMLSFSTGTASTHTITHYHLNQTHKKKSVSIMKHEERQQKERKSHRSLEHFQISWQTDTDGCSLLHSALWLCSIPGPPSLPPAT